MTATKPNTLRLVDAETGETYTETWGETTDATFKGWLLRTRTAYRQRTGHSLRVERIER